MKVLVTACPDSGSLQVSLARVRAVVQKNGPFAGGWFWLWGDLAGQATAEFVKELEGDPVFSGTPIHLVAGGLQECAVKGDLVVLGGSSFGVTEAGFSVGNLCGSAKHLPEKCPPLIDFYFSFNSPKEIAPPAEGPPKHSQGGLFCQLYASSRIRYHFAIGKGFFERRPFAVKSEQCRFIVLGCDSERWHYALNTDPGAHLAIDASTGASPFDAPEAVPERNFFYGNAQASEDQTAAYLSRLRQGAEARKPPEGYSCRHCLSALHFYRDCPHAAKARDAEIGAKRAAFDGIEQHGVDSNNPPPGYICHQCRQPGHFIRFCPQRKRPTRESRPAISPATNFELKRAVDASASLACWFCLANPSVRKDLIERVGKSVYLARPLKEIGRKHRLIIPIEHITDPRTASLDWTEIEEFERSVGPSSGAIRLVARMVRPQKHHWIESVFLVSHPSIQDMANEIVAHCKTETGFDCAQSGAPLKHFTKRFEMILADQDHGTCTTLCLTIDFAGGDPFFPVTFAADLVEKLFLEK